MTDLDEVRRLAAVAALRAAAEDFFVAARAGIEPALNRTAGKILEQRALLTERQVITFDASIPRVLNPRTPIPRRALNG